MSGIITGPHFIQFFGRPGPIQVGSMVAVLEVGAFGMCFPYVIVKPVLTVHVCSDFSSCWPSRRHHWPKGNTIHRGSGVHPGWGGTDIYNRIRSNGGWTDCQWIRRRSSIVRYNLRAGRVPIADVFAAPSCLFIRVKYHRQIMYDVYPIHIHCWLNSCREEPWLA